MLAGDLGAVARRGADRRAAPALARFALQARSGRSQPMLAQTGRGHRRRARDGSATAALEWKLDGARVQVHARGDEVRVYSRALQRGHARRARGRRGRARAAGARRSILDGEAIALRADGRPHPFQVTMRRFGRKLDVDALRARAAALAVLLRRAPPRRRGPARRCRRASASRAARDGCPALARAAHRHGERATRREAFLDEALARGHEGVMAKALDAPYEAGGRGAAWLKVKRAHTLDLVVLAAEWGSGAAQGWLSATCTWARATATGGFVMLGKTFKGMTDEMLAWQTRRDSRSARSRRDGHIVYVRARARGRDRVRRRAGEPALPGRHRAAVRAGQALPAGQGRRPRRKHGRDGAGHPRAKVPGARSDCTL